MRKLCIKSTQSFVESNQSKECIIGDCSLLRNLFPDGINECSGGLYTIAGRPSIGKSIIADIVAIEMMKLYGKHVKYIQCQEDCNEAIFRKIGAGYDFLYERGVSVKRVEEELKNPDIDVIIIDSYYCMNRKGIDCAAELKKLSVKYHKMVFVLSYVSRRADYRKDKRPKKQDMTKRMCDSLWESSDAVFFLYRDNYYDKTKNNDTEIIIAKNEYQSFY